MNINEKEARLIFKMGQEVYDKGQLTEEMLDFIQKLSANMCTIDVSKWDYIYNADSSKIIK
ncbi:MAG: hypothetical protein GTO02_06780 [Candidatus Dadabacteria bacterium]|nr:hypothetical protein [Candidatus Dadabacteria bacterium]NIQ14104.1 hypothetical protein [Candidatus Dadabacteria bacterium]